MLTFSQFLNEAGDATLPYTYQGEKDEYGRRYHRYTFANGGRDYRVNIAHHDIPHHIADVNFGDHTDHGDSFGVQTITNRAKHSAVRVMSTVHNIVKHHLSKHPEIEEVHFSSSPDEPSRGRLYAKYTEKHGGITDPTAYETYHVIPARSYKMSESFLNEAGDATLPFKYDGSFDAGDNEVYHRYSFSYGGNKYNTFLTHKNKLNPHVSVSFAQHTPSGRHTYWMTNKSGSSAIKVMSTVHNIIKHHLAKHPEIKGVRFTSDDEEPSRVKVYTRYTEKHGGQTKELEYGEHLHIIPARSYKMTNESEEPVRIQLGKPKGERAQKFMVDFTNDSDEHPFNPAARILHGAVVHASRDGNQVHIHDIRTTDPKSGAGAKALKHLTSLADKHNVKLNLFAKAYSNRPEHIRSTPRLIKWYEKHGFKHDEQDYDPDYGSEMTYYPK